MKKLALVVLINTLSLPVWGAEPWTVTVCRKYTLVDHVTLQGGSSHDDNKVFDTWKQAAKTDSFPLPAQYQELPKVFFQATTDTDGDMELCVKHKGVAKKRIHMTRKGKEDHDIKDSDKENSCHC